jgi:hypothetical protein
MTDKEEQEWINKYRAAIDAGSFIKESRWKTLLTDVSRVLGAVRSVTKRSGNRVKFTLRRRMLRQPAKLGLPQARVAMLAQRQRAASVLRKPIAMERPLTAQLRRKRS